MNQCIISELTLNQGAFDRFHCRYIRGIATQQRLSFLFLFHYTRTPTLTIKHTPVINPTIDTLYKHNPTSQVISPHYLTPVLLIGLYPRAVIKLHAHSCRSIIERVRYIVVPVFKGQLNIQTNLAQTKQVCLSQSGIMGKSKSEICERWGSFYVFALTLALANWFSTEWV